MLLSDLKPGDRFSVFRVLSGGEIGKRLADMGFTEGAEGAFVRGAFLRGPLQVTIRGYALLIRRGEAKMIEVSRLLLGANVDADIGAGASPARSWRKSRARRFLVSLFSEPDCCSGSRRRAKRGGK